MAVVYRDADGDLSLLMDKTIAVLGYGHVGRAYALNLRDSAFPVLVGNQADAYAQQAYRDGFEVTTIADATVRADTILLMLPDEIATQAYLRDIAPGLRQRNVLVFASGFNIAFGFIEPPPFVDVVLVAPQAVGDGVREGYVAGSGFPSFVAVSQDVSGEAWARVLSIAKALGALHQGAIELTFKQETELDLFHQQALMPALLSLLQTALEVLLREGFPPEAVFTSLYASGELGFVVSKWAENGLIPSLRMHSQTGQYGILTHLEQFKEVKLKHQMESVLDHIRGGGFAQEWAAEYADGYPRLKALRQHLEHLSHWEHEREILERLKVQNPPGE